MKYGPTERGITLVYKHKIKTLRPVPDIDPKPGKIT